MKKNEIEGKTLLLVDDKPENLDILVTFLEKYNLNIIVATSGEEALQLLEYNKPDILLLDIMMPGIDGFEVCRRMKESDEYNEIPVIFMTAIDDTVDKIRGLELGAVDYITKPYKMEEVFARIKNILYVQDLKNQLETMKTSLTGEQTGDFDRNMKTEGSVPYGLKSSNKIVFIVEDNEDDIHLLKTLLEQYYYKIIIAKSCKELFQQLIETKPNIIILDVLLPGIDGFEVCRRLKEKDEYREIPVIFITALNDTVDKIKGLELGAIDYITKPFDDGEVVARISTQLKIGRLLKESEDSNIKLRELDRLKTMFIASMSHELRTPLNSIIGFNGLLLQETCGKLNSEQKDFLNRAYKSSKLLLGLINDVIDISKIECGMIKAAPELFKLDEVINEAIDVVSGQNAKNDGIEWKVDVASDLEIYSDSKRILQCLLNFLSNAVKFTKNGSISVSAAETDGMIEIEVKDTGIGIAEVDLSKLFQPFERMGSLQTKVPGTGLGLYLTKKLATEILGGSVRVESQLGVGSKFLLKLSKNINQKQTKKGIAP